MKKVSKILSVRLQLMYKHPYAAFFAEGEVSTSGWTRGMLIPAASQPISPDMLLLDFVAKEPDGPSSTVITDIAGSVFVSELTQVNLEEVKIIRIQAEHNYLDLILEAKS